MIATKYSKHVLYFKKCIDGELKVVNDVYINFDQIKSFRENDNNEVEIAMIDGDIFTVAIGINQFLDMVMQFTFVAKR